MLGEEVRTLVKKWQSKGNYEVDWNGMDNNGRNVASGIYFYQLEFKGFKDAKRMLLIK
jgi:flagellar hook assembly protein FlgD